MTNLAQQLTKLDTFDAAEWVGVRWSKGIGTTVPSSKLSVRALLVTSHFPDLRDPRALGVLWGMAYRQGVRVECTTLGDPEVVSVEITRAIVEASKCPAT